MHSPKLRLLCLLLVCVLLALFSATPVLASDPTLVYSLRLGGTGGRSGLYTSAYDSATAVAVAPDGSVWVAGTTWSPDFPLVNPLTGQLPTFLHSASFLARVSADGSTLLSSTCFPATIHAIAVDASGSVYVAGSTT